MKPHRLPRFLTSACACVLVLAGMSAAAAQFLPGPGQAPRSSGLSSPFPPAPGQGGAQSSAFPPPPGQQGPQSTAQSVCASFPPIRQAAEQAAGLIRAAGERKAPREEVCGLFKNFAAKEAKMVKFLVDHKTACGVPPQAIASVKNNHAKTLELRKNICSAGPPPGGPSLSDALGGPIIADDSASKQPGRGTFDTLTGNVLAR